MQRQKSILAFLRKPDSAGGKTTISDASDQEITGADTPPEKVPRRIFADNRSSVFASIKHKFSKVQTSSFNSSMDNISSAGTPPLKSCEPDNLSNKFAAPEELDKQSVSFAATTMSSEGDKTWLFSNTIEDAVVGPDTPGTKPLVPRLKRVQEDVFELEGRADGSVLDNGKRLRLAEVTDVPKKNHEENSETYSKFEWLHPSHIRDANGRKPGDPCYDRKTLYIPADALRKMSASQRQYWDVKRQYMDVVLFFKVGKFYELYELDAEVGHKELDWKITLSGVGKCRQVGVSESGVDDAVQKLVARGYKVGRMEQLETSEQAKSRGSTSVIRRKLIHVVTPSTSSEGNLGPDAIHLLAIKEGSLLNSDSKGFGFAFVDCAALKFWVGSVTDDASCATLGALLLQVSPKEILCESRGLSNEVETMLKKYNSRGESTLKHIQLDIYDASDSGAVPCSLNPVGTFAEATEVINIIGTNKYFHRSSNPLNHIIDGVVHQDLALCALGGVISHLLRLMLHDVICNGDILSYKVYEGFLRMDGQTLVNLEILNNNVDGGPSGTLYKFLNNCITSFGKRLLRNWMCHPLQDVENINNRLDVVERLMANSEIMLHIADCLRKLPDLDRLLGRVKSSTQSSNSTLLPFIGSKILKQRVKVFGSLVKGLRIGMGMLMTLQTDGHFTTSLSKVISIPMLTGSEGLDKYLVQFEAAIDSDFPNYQNHNVTDLEAETLSVLIELFIEKATEWSQMIHAISCIDVLRSFAIAAISSCGAMCRPIVLPPSKIKNSYMETMCPILSMRGLWHPYALSETGGMPVPNDVLLGGDRSSQHPGALLLTGPNMGGKSTLLRATCLAVILAQLGCYVPCVSCTVSVVDILFTRLGASDHIMTGESTFLVECTETASVLQNATQNSLVLLDELGRGTSTFDGYAIAYAVFRHLIESVNCRLLFATHYHPLTKEFATHPRVNLQHMACCFDQTSNSSSQVEQKLVFLYKLVSGACPESYGMQVAHMAGIPHSVIHAATKAGQIMKEKVGVSFKSSEQRKSFSTMHEEWLKSLISIAKAPALGNDSDNDIFDSLFCIWHELKTSCKEIN